MRFGEKSPPWLKQQLPLAAGALPLEAIGRTRRAETQPGASSRVVPVPCPWKHPPLQTPLGCPKNDPRDCWEPVPGSGSQQDSRISKVSSSVHPAPGAVEGLKAPVGAGQQPRSLSPSSGEDVGCVHRHSSLNLGLQGSLEEPRPDVRFQGHVLAPPSHRLRAQRVQLTLLPALLWDSCWSARTCLVNSTNLLKSLILTAAKHHHPSHPLPPKRRGVLLKTKLLIFYFNSAFTSRSNSAPGKCWQLCSTAKESAMEALLEKGT